LPKEFHTQSLYLVAIYSVEYYTNRGSEGNRWQRADFMTVTDRKDRQTRIKNVSRSVLIPSPMVEKNKLVISNAQSRKIGQSAGELK